VRDTRRTASRRLTSSDVRVERSGMRAGRAASAALEGFDRGEREPGRNIRVRLHNILEQGPLR